MQTSNSQGSNSEGQYEVDQDDEEGSFSEPSSSDDGMFDMFTGRIKTTDGGDEREQLVENRQCNGLSEYYVYESLRSWVNIRVLDIEPEESAE
jgi:hypothetical protein